MFLLNMELMKGSGMDATLMILPKKNGGMFYMTSHL